MAAMSGTIGHGLWQNKFLGCPSDQNLAISGSPDRFTAHILRPGDRSAAALLGLHKITLYDQTIPRANQEDCFFWPHERDGFMRCQKMIHPTLSINIKKINGVQFQDLIWISFVWCYNVSVQQYSRNQVSMIAADGFVPVWSQRICNIHNGMCIYKGLLVISGASQYYGVICNLIPLVFIFFICESWSYDYVTFPISMESRPWFNIKMSSCRYRKSHCGDKMVVRSSYLHNGISYTGKITSLYWIRALLVRARVTTPLLPLDCNTVLVIVSLATLVNSKPRGAFIICSNSASQMLHIYTCLPRMPTTALCIVRLTGHDESIFPKILHFKQFG